MGAVRPHLGPAHRAQRAERRRRRPAVRGAAGVGRRLRHRHGRSHAPRPARELDIYEQTFAPLHGRRAPHRRSPATTIAWATTSRARSCPGRACRAPVRPGLYVVRVNSTAPHNRSWLNGHGSLDDDDLDAIDAALDAAPAGHLVVIALHHHVLPMPEEHAMERLSSWLGFIFTASCRAGATCWPGCAGAAIWCCTGTATFRAARGCSGRRGHARVQRRLVDRAGARARVRARRPRAACWAGRCGWTSPRRGRPRTRRWRVKPACR